MASTDGTMGVVPAMLAERLGLPQVTFASELTVEGRHGHDPPRRRRRVARPIEASLPALVSVTDQINEPRYPSFKGIMAAKKKPVETWALADLGVDADAGRPRRRLDQGRVVHRAPAAHAGPDRHRRGRRRHEARRVPRRAEVHLSRPTPQPQQGDPHAMAEVLVLVDHVDGTVRKTTLELLTIARRLGEPVRRLRRRRAATPPRRRSAEYGAAEGLPRRGRRSRRLPRRPEGRAAGPARRRRPRRPRCWSRPPPRARRSPPAWRSRPAPASSPTPSTSRPVDGGAGDDAVGRSPAPTPSRPRSPRAPRSSRSSRTRPPPEEAAGAAAEEAVDGRRLRRGQGGPDHRPPAPRERPAAPS